MWGYRSSRTLVVGTAFAAFSLLCVLPSAYMLAHAGATGAYAALLLDARQRALLANTALLGAGTALLASVIGVPLGLILARVPLRRVGLWRIALAAPVLLPPYVVALAWIYFGGSAGLVAATTGVDLLSRWTYSLPGAVVVLSLVLYPLSMLATEVALRRIEPRLEEGALVAAPPAQVLRRITLPLAAPAIAAAALIVFVLAISEFGVPALLRVRVFTTEVFTAFAALYDFRRATMLTLPLLGLSIAVAVAAALLVRDRLVVTRRGATRSRPLVLVRRTGAATAAACGVLIVALVVPLAVLTREATSGPAVGSIVRGSGGAMRASLLFAALGATAATAVAVWIGYARARSRSRLGTVIDAALVTLFAVPSTVVGVGLIGVWNRAGVPGEVYGTEGMLLLASLARFLPVAALALAAGIRYVPASHEEAAAVGGARWWPTMIRIVLPQTRLVLASTWAIVFILAFGELGASILVAPPGEATLPIRIYTLIANAPPAHVAALALLQSAVVLAPLLLLGVAVRAR